MVYRRASAPVTVALLGAIVALVVAAAPVPRADYATLVALFDEWRTFERPALRGGIPDYSAAAMSAKAAGLRRFRSRLDAIDPSKWPIEQQNDYKLVKAEMNGFDFNLRVLRPWARDPAFYVSVWPSRTDVPSREAPVSSPEILLYDYTYPLSVDAQRDLSTKIGVIPALLRQAKVNLAQSTARDLWVYGKQELAKQSRALTQLENGSLAVSSLEGRQRASLTGASAELIAAVTTARSATDDFIAWLDSLAPTKKGPSGVGKQQYTWYQQNVHFIPWSWEDEVVLLRRELERAHASLRLVEHDNRNLPPLDPPTDAATFDRIARTHMDRFTDFLVSQRIIPDKPYIKAVMEPHLARFSPGDRGSFFSRVTQREPMLLLSHDYHWLDLARMRDEPHASPIRRGALLSNIWDTRAEGFATAFEEMLMHAGLYDNNPRAKELVWIMLANRAARGLASLYVQSNAWTLRQAGRFHAEWTPRGWSNPDDELTAFEQLLYLRQPGYGTSYVTGKIQFDDLSARWARQRELEGKPFVLSELMDRFNNAGMIPIPLIAAELVGPTTTR
jgi:uncharacterized protein (DUF885 family)